MHKKLWFNNKFFGTSWDLAEVGSIQMVSLWISHEIVNDINTMLCPIEVNSNIIELTVYASWYCILDLLCANNN